jgi:membrane protein
VYSPIKHWLKVFRSIARRFVTVGCWHRAAALTFTSLLSIVPLMTVSFAILMAFPEFKATGSRLQDFIFSHFVVASGEIIQQYLQSFVAKASQLSTLGILFLIITAVAMMFTMEETFNAIWRVKERRQWLASLLLYWTILTLSPILIGIGFTVSSYLISLPFMTSASHLFGFTNQLLALTPFFLSVIAFTLIYIAVPNCSVPLRYGLIAAIIAALLFELAKSIFALYVALFPSYELLYGALAAIPIFFLWVYLCWLITLLGAVMSEVLATSYHEGGIEKLDGFTQAIIWLGYFWRAQQEGKSLTLSELLFLDKVGNYEVPAEEQLQTLVNNKLLQHTAKDGYILSRDFSTFTLFDLRKCLPWPIPATNKIPKHTNLLSPAFLTTLQKAEQCLSESLNEPMANMFIK